MLKFNVRNQSISRIDNFRPAEKSIKYLLAQFDFKTDDWKETVKTAVFRNAKTGKTYDAILDGNVCVVPWEALSESGACEVSVYGIKEDGSRITTNSDVFNLNSTIYGGSATQDPSPTVYETLVLGIGKLENKVGKLEDEFENFEPSQPGGTGGSIAVDSELSEESENPVQNKVVAEKLNGLDKDIEELTRKVEDSTVDSEDIVGALGYTPAKQGDVSRLSEEIADLNGNFEKTSINLFNKNNALLGYYFDVNNSVVSTNTSNFLCYVPISHDGTYQLTIAGHIYGMKGACKIPCFNANKEFVNYLTATTEDTIITDRNKAELIITEDDISENDIAYIGLTGRKTALDVVMVVESNEYPENYIPYKEELFIHALSFTNNQKVTLSNLYKKVISFNGDSICYGEGFRGGYGKIIAERNGMTYENIGVSGGTITEGTGAHCISSTVLNMREDADYIILEGGVNDMTRNNLGTISNNFNTTLDTTTFCGAFEQMIKNAIARFPGKKIGYIAVHRLKQWAPDDYNTVHQNTGYYEAAINICKKWGIPVCDLTINCPSLYENDSLKQMYTKDADGWHPNEAGYRAYYVPKIEAWLKTL